MITIYTDGSCLTNPGNGGWAAIINDGKEIKKISGNEKNTTNNRMELLAPINALKDMEPGVEIKIFTDSQYVKNDLNPDILRWFLKY
jgi:ribonuclease HI